MIKKIRNYLLDRQVIKRFPKGVVLPDGSVTTNPVYRLKTTHYVQNYTSVLTGQTGPTRLPEGHIWETHIVPNDNMTPMNRAAMRNIIKWRRLLPPTLTQEQKIDVAAKLGQIDYDVWPVENPMKTESIVKLNWANGKMGWYNGVDRSDPGEPKNYYE